MSTPYRPEGFHTVTPYLIVPDAARLIQFLVRAFDAQELVVVHDDAGKIRHAGFRVGDSVVELGDANPEWKPMTAGLHVYVEDADAAYHKAIAAGATSLYEPADMPYGERSGGVMDPAGNHWYLATLLKA
jgi:PhnB protein